MPLAIAITGGSGFIGRPLTRALIGRGHRVRSLARSAASAERSAADGAVPVAGDLARPARSLGPLVADAEVVIHLGAAVDPAEAADARRCQRINVDGTAALLAACSGAHPPRFLLASSIAAMGIRHLGGDRLATEATPCLPTTPYGRSKLAAERLLAGYPGEATAFRPPTVYGPGERYNFLALTRAVQAGTFRVLGQGTNRLSLCAVGNLVHALLLMVEAPRLGPCYLVDDGAPLTLLQLSQQLHRALGRRPPAWRVPRAAALAAGLLLGVGGRLAGRSPPLDLARVRTLTADFAFDCAAARRDLGYRPPTAPAAALAQTVAWYRAAGLLPG